MGMSITDGDLEGGDHIENTAYSENFRFDITKIFPFHILALYFIKTCYSFEEIYFPHYIILLGTRSLYEETLICHVVSIWQRIQYINT